MKYKYETHCHTAEGSSCSRLPAKDAVALYLSLGYTGIVITDHFTGSTTVPPHYKWKDRVNHFFAGCEAARAEGEKAGLDVFFSLEYSDKGNDFLLYGIERDFLLENPDMREIGITALLRRVRDAGGFIIHAHPFAQAKWIPEIRLFPDLTDAVEVLNGGDTEGNYNRRAVWYADEYGLPKTGGTDTHASDQKPVTGIAVERRAKDILDLAAQIKAGKARVLSLEGN